MRNTKKPIQLYRGTTQQHSDYAGPVGEITVDTEKYTVVVQNGVTGGVPLAREDTVVSLTNRIAAEESARATADTALQKSITNEVSARKAADTAIQKSVTDEVSTRKAADTALQKSITDEASALQKSITDEASARETADTALQKSITDEASARETADTAIQKSVTGEVSARKAADTALQKSITDEASARETADTALQNDIASEASSRETADTALSNRLDVVEPVLVASDFTGDTNTVKKYVDAAMKNRASLASPAFSGTPTAPTADKGTNSTQIATTAFVQAAISEASGAVIGEIRWFAMSTPPEGWLVCNGAAVGRAAYPELFAAIGTIYGTGDGSTTFNLPNLVGKFVEGSATSGIVKAAGLPNITGTLSKSGDAAGYFQVFNGAFYADSQSNRNSLQRSNDTYFLANGGKFDASRCSSIYGNSTTVQPPALCLLTCIRYE